MKQKTKRIILSLCLVVLFGGIGGGYYVYDNLERFVPPMLIPPAYFWIDKDQPLEKQTTLVFISNREFKIPTMYIESRVKGGKKEGSVYLQYILPNFESKLQYPDQKARRKIFEERRYVGVLIKDASKMAPFDQLIDHRFNTLQKVHRNEDFYGLESYNWSRTPGQNENNLPEHMLIEKNENGKVISFIDCDMPKPKIFPICQHRFIDNGIQYKISYNKAKYLSSWQEQRQKAIKFINSFEVQPANELAKELH